MVDRVLIYLGNTSIWTGLGFGVEENYNRMISGESGLKRIDAECSEGLTRLETMMVRVINEVVGEEMLVQPRTGMIFSTTKGNIAEISIKVPKEGSEIYLQTMAKKVCRAVGYSGEPIVISNACISGVTAVVVAQRLIRAGWYDNVIVVGGDEMTEFTTSGFMAFKSVSETPCRPYDKNRDGLSLGEATGALLLTNDKTKSAGVVVAGGWMSNDANHISGPSRTGEPLGEAMVKAMADAGVTAEEITFVNAHGTATVYNDEMESKAVNYAGLEDKPINSLKPYVGHTLGASGIIEIAIAAEELKRGIVIGTKGFETLGTPMPLNVSAENRMVKMKHCLKSASGFGGCNASVVLSLEAEAKGSTRIVEKGVEELGKCEMYDGKLIVNSETRIESSEKLGEFVREVYHKQEANLKFFKMSDMCKMGYLAANEILQGMSYEPYEMAIVMSNKSASLDADLQHWRIMKVEGKPASPAAFVYTLPNIVMGEIAIKNGIKGESTFIVTDNEDDERVKQYAQLLLSIGYKYVLTGWCELLDDDYKLKMKLITTK